MTSLRQVHAATQSTASLLHCINLKFFLKYMSHHSFFLALREQLCEAGERLGRSRFRVRVIIQTITHREKGGPSMEAWKSSFFDSRPTACVCGRDRKREGVRVLTVKWWAVLVYRWATAGRVRVAGSLPALACLLPVCPPRPSFSFNSFKRKIYIYFAFTKTFEPVFSAHFNP